jgi:hypothetical protein
LNRIANRNKEFIALHKGPLPDSGKAIGQLDTNQARAAAKGLRPDAGKASGQRDAAQVALEKGLLPDAGNARRQRDADQSLALVKGLHPDLGNACGYGYVSTESGISNQHRAFNLKIYSHNFLLLYFGNKILRVITFYSRICHTVQKLSQNAITKNRIDQSYQSRIYHNTRLNMAIHIVDGIHRNIPRE